MVDGPTCPFSGSWCSLVWERRTTCWVAMWVPDTNMLAVRRPPPFDEGRDLDHHVSVCSEGVRACLGGGGGGPPFGPAPFLLGGGGGVGAAKGLLRCFLVPKGNQPTACTLALWWLKFGPTDSEGGGLLVAVPLTPGARGSCSAAAAVPPAIPPLPHFSVGPFATARTGSLPRRGRRAIASPRGALVGCGRIDTLLPGRGSGSWGLPRGGVTGASTATIPTATGAGCVP